MRQETRLGFKISSFAVGAQWPSCFGNGNDAVGEVLRFLFEPCPNFLHIVDSLMKELTRQGDGSGWMTDKEGWGTRSLQFHAQGQGGRLSVSKSL
mmetsp:Transcript_24730/g.60762  ORF Transcript_24730/g.60762 Transcript_24730/m.60762 type:complete len:95 (-) Transcript_24730:451-735(-)